MVLASREQLIEYVNQGNPVEYLFFWGPGERDGAITRACLCQWYESPFVVDGVHYPTAEHYMMAEKARLFGDALMRERILAAPSPGDAKMLGRHVQGYDEQSWRERRFDIVVAGSLAKFAQNPALQQFLLDTGDQVLVEASPIDTIWAVGMAEEHPDITHPGRWRGLNLLGFALMVARKRLRNPRPGP